MYIFHMDALAYDHDETIQRLPRRNGLLLWRGLYEAHLGRMGVIVTAETEPEALETWMRLHNIRAVVYEIMDPNMGPIDQQIEDMMISNGMRTGDMYVDTNPHLVAQVLSRGIPTLLLGDPYVVRKEWSQEEAPLPRQWDEVVAEIDRQTVLRTKKEWQYE